MRPQHSQTSIPIDETVVESEPLTTLVALPLLVPVLVPVLVVVTASLSFCVLVTCSTVSSAAVVGIDEGACPSCDGRSGDGNGS